MVHNAGTQCWYPIPIIKVHCMLRIARNFLETTKKTSKFQAILPDQFGVILMGMKQKIETAYSKKWKFSKSPILKFFSRKFHRLVLGWEYSIVKDSSADLGVNFKIVQNRPTVKAVCAKSSQLFLLHICQYFYFSARK